MARTKTGDRLERLRFRRAPLAAAAVWFGGGITLAHFVWQPVLVLVAALVLTGALAVVTLATSPRVSWLPVAAIWIIAGMAAAEWQPGPPDSSAVVSYADGLSRRVVGRVTRVQKLPARAKTMDDDKVAPWEAAEESEPDAEQAESVDLALEQIEEVTPDVASMVPIRGGLRNTIYATAPSSQEAHTTAQLPELACGDLVEMTVRLKLPERFRDPGVWQYADYLREQGIGARASLAANRLHRLGAGPATWHCRVVTAQSWAVARLAGFVGSGPNRRMPGWMRLGSADAAMLDAMLFGDRAGLNRTMRTGFERTGSFHLFVVSGLHVTLLAGGVFWLVRRLRGPAWLATGVTIAAATGYAVLTGFGQPVTRALTMTSIFLLARLFWRKGDSINALGAAVLAMLVWSPKSLFEASFQMTVLALVAVAGMAAPLGERSFGGYAKATRNIFATGVRGGLSPRRMQLRVMLQLWGEAFTNAFGRWSRGLPALTVRWGLLALELALVGVVAELVMVLPMALYFHRAAVFSVPANMVVIPVLAVLAPAAVATFAASLVSPRAALAPSTVTALLLHGVTWAIGRISSLSTADVRVPGPVWWVGALAVLAWMACCWAVRRGRWGAWVTAAALPLIAVMVLWPERPLTTPEQLELSAIDVGQGDSLLIAGPDGRTMLVDAGGPVGQHGVSEVTASYDIGEEVVSPYLWSRRMRRLDVVVLTHAHTDHMGGMPAVLRNFRPHELWVGIEPDSAQFRALLKEAQELGIIVRHLHAGEGFGWGETTVLVLAPAVGYVNMGAPKNDDSVVLRMDFGRGSLLLEGDAERPSEEAMLAAGLVKPVTVLKVGHHGSITSTTPEFLAAAAPRDAVISVGRGNTFGHPRGEVIGRFAAARVRLYRTDEFGLSTFLLGRDGTVKEAAGTQAGSQ